ncbi:conserved hypothetical protein [Altererythrobacter sp. B11]|uniref:GumC family protein n=1 Tax=Altererythrobacter sp. B11 TaxID=2060312 RepID=UPI000DC71C98|nr:polysaccharide biosynthesis tyrosine autokinase [Altererythrobacter sp. B11]BBC70952.1 conserved hypothetical protein [Altererythrobacter sp. B11]
MTDSMDTAGYEARLSDALRSLKSLLRRRWLTLSIVTVTVFAICATVIMLMGPKYEAIARVQIDPTRDPTVAASNSAQADLGSEAIETEVSILNSAALARQVTEALNLQRDPEFAPSLEPDEAAQLTPEERLQAVSRKVRDNLTVGRDRLTYVINIAYESKDPAKSAAIANAFAESYLATKVGDRVGTAEQQAKFYRDRLDELAGEVRAADSAVAAYRARAGIVEGMGNSTIVDQQIGPLSTQLATAESEAAEARATLAAARRQIAQGGLDAVSAVRGSPVISDLRRQRAEVLRNMGEVLARYGERHPESIKIREQLSALDQQIQDEAQRAIGSLEAQASAAEARVSSLRSTMRRMESEQSSNTRAAATANTLEREAESKREAYDRLAELAQKSEQNVSNTIARATIVDRAVPPASPTSPNRPLLLVLALVVACATGGATIIVQELMVAGIRSVGEFESAMGVSILAALPRVKNARPADLVVDKPGTMYAEAIRVARSTLIRLQPAPKSIAIASALPEEGKSTTSVALARMLALNGEKVLLIDCDLRRAALGQVVPSSVGAPGTVELLSGAATMQQAIVPDRVPGLDLIYVRTPQVVNEDMFGERFRTFLRKAGEQYDRVVLDLPPLGGLADGRAIAAAADATLLIVKWGSTPSQPIEASVNWLETDGANLVGAIFSMVDPSSEAMGGIYYSNKYGNYYQKA